MDKRRKYDIQAIKDWSWLISLVLVAVVWFVKVDKLPDRVEALEAKTGAHTTEIAVIQSEVKGMREDITFIKNWVARQK